MTLSLLLCAPESCSKCWTLLLSGAKAAVTNFSSLGAKQSFAM